MKTIFAENGGYDVDSGSIPGEFDITSASLTQDSYYHGPRRVSLKLLGRALRRKTTAKTYLPTVPVSRYGKLLYSVYVRNYKTLLYLGCVKFKGTAARELRQAALKASR